jgi:hypothetical protein
MSKHQIVRSLRQEIRKLNRIIDQKIILGQSYYNESRRHKFLMSQLNRLAPSTSLSSGWFSRSMSFASVFML